MPCSLITRIFEFLFEIILLEILFSTNFNVEFLLAKSDKPNLPSKYNHAFLKSYFLSKKQLN